jgi:hypothetical protein
MVLGLTFVIETHYEVNHIPVVRNMNNFALLFGTG